MDFFSSRNESHLINFVYLAVISHDDYDTGSFSFASGGRILPANITSSEETAAPIVMTIVHPFRGPTLVLHDILYLDYYLRGQARSAVYNFVSRINAVNAHTNVEVLLSNFFSGTVRIFTNSM